MKNYLLLLFLICTQLWSQGAVRLSAIFTDGMVLQQKSSVPIWGWADPFAKVTIQTSWDNKKYSTQVDQHGKWKVAIHTPQAGGAYQIKIVEKNVLVLNDVLIGEVWLCSGQSNMEMPMKGYPSQPIIGSTEAILESDDNWLRLYTVPRNPTLVPAADSKPSTWKKAEPQSVSNFSATAYFFGKRLRKNLKVPIGLIHSSYGGSTIEAWMEEAWLADIKDIDIPRQEAGLKDKNRIPTFLFNGMINPIAGYGIKGMIWYQGESNYQRPEEYAVLFPRMVEKYRSIWGKNDLPFYFMQIAPFDYSSLAPIHTIPINSAYIRDVQRKTLNRINNAGMVVAMDLGEKNCIHPANKQIGADRFALLALGDAYAILGLDHKSPLFDKLEIKGSTAVVSFKDAPLGLSSFGREIKTFEIAGKDKKFYPAEAILRGKTVVVSSPYVEEPMAVRYAFKDFVVGDLFGVNGLPLSSFRSDDW